MMEYFNYEFFRNAVISILIIGMAGAMIGTYIIMRRMVALTGGLTHACFGGLGLGYFLGVNPVITAMIFAVLSSLGVEWISGRYRVREDSAIAVVWSIGMAVGILFVFLTPGYVPELNAFLFGNILTVTTGDLWAFGALTFVITVFFSFCHKSITACAFDSEFYKVSGVKVKLINYTMTILVAVCIVLTIRLVGIMLLISMLTVPVLIAEIWKYRFISIMRLAVILSMITGVAGLWLATVIDVPCSAIIVLIQVGVYGIARGIRDISFRRQIQ